MNTDAQRLVRLERLAPPQRFEFLQALGQTPERPDAHQRLKRLIAAPGGSR
jgi:hypothetical protein